MGFNLHASKSIESEDRESLECILRYMGGHHYQKSASIRLLMHQFDIDVKEQLA